MDHSTDSGLLFTNTLLQKLSPYALNKVLAGCYITMIFHYLGTI